MAHLFGKFVWFEHLSADIAAARAFYGEVFGWTIEDSAAGGTTYPMIRNGADAIGGFRAVPPGAPPHWIGYLSVADVDAAARAVAAAGGQTTMPPTEFAAFGRGAAVTDPQGAPFSLWKSAQGDPPDREHFANGEFCWNELMARDAEAALAFYERAFGFTHDTRQMPGGPYYVLKKDGVARGGVMKIPDPQAPPGWTPYVRVADCGETLARVQGAGGTTLLPVTEIPDIGKFAWLRDAVGAPLAIMTPA